MKRGLFVFVFLVSAATGGYYLYTSYVSKEETSIQMFVPASAILAYEPGDCIECNEMLNASSLWNLVINGAKEHQTSMDSLIGALRKSNPALVSLHVINKDNYDLIYYEKQSKLKNQINFLGQEKHVIKQRTFNGIVINEIKFNRAVFSWISEAGYLVGTTTPFLIEDVIRTYKHERPHFFELNKSHQPAIKNTSDDAGNLHIQFDAVKNLTNVFTAMKSVTSIAGYANLDIRTESGNLIMGGFTADSTQAKSHLISALKGQSPVPFELKQYISTRTVATKTIGISNGNSLQEDLSRYRTFNRVAASDSIRSILLQNNIPVNTLFSDMQGHITTCWFESFQSRTVASVLLIETKKPTTWLFALDKLSAKLSIDSIFSEKFGDHQIRRLPVANFCGSLLSPLVNETSATYYTSVDNVIILGENLADLKMFLSDIEEGETWSKSIDINKFLRSTFLESTLSWFVDAPRAVELLSYNIKPEWKRFVQQNRSLVRSIGWTALQFSHLNTNFYTQIFIQNNPTTDQTNTNRYQSNFTSPIVALYPVKSHVNRADEVLIQDSTNGLSLISQTGSVQWTLPLPGRLTSDVTQVDFFANGKLQYFFTTQSQMHLIDRNGDNVEPFPIEVFGSDIEHASVVDYDNSKKYRFLISEMNGDVWMYDKDGHVLDGWNPRHFDKRLHRGAKHYRLHGKDYIIAVTDDGVLHATNRRGENLKNFPVKMKAKVNGDYFVDAGKSASDTHIVMVTDDGHKIKINLEGELIGKEVLQKTSVLTNFSLISEKTSKSYVILQHDKEHCNILDENGKVLISAGAGIASPRVTFYDFGAGNRFFTISDPVQMLTYLYDGQGNMVISVPLDSYNVALRPTHNDELRMFVSQHKTILIEDISVN